MRLYKYGKLLKNITQFDLQQLGIKHGSVGTWLLGKNGNVGYIEEEITWQGEKGVQIRWMHGGMSHWWPHLLELDVLTEKPEQSPMPETVFHTENSINWHPSAKNILQAGKIQFIEIVPNSKFKEMPSEVLAYMQAKDYESDILLVKFDNGCEIGIFDRTNQGCCEHRFIETKDDLQSFIGESFRSVDIIDVENPEEYLDEHGKTLDAGTEQTFIRFQTNRDHFTANVYNVSNGHYGELDAGVVVYVPHPTLDRPNTPYFRLAEDMDHKELHYNMNTMLQMLNVRMEKVDHLV